MSKKILVIGLVLILFTGIFLRISMLNNDFSAEETDFVNPATAIKNTGHPIFYDSELYPKMTALWHPPMYIYTMALFFSLSEGEIVARSINVVFSILTAILIFFFCTNMIKYEKGIMIGLISSAFFLINYYILSSSMLIDIDMLSAFFVFGFVYFILRNYQTKKNYFLVLAGIFFFFSLANRYPMAILSYIGIGIYYYINKELKPNFKNYFITGAISSLAFVLVWGIYSTLIEPGNFFSFISHNAHLGSEQFTNLQIYFGSFVLNISQFIRLFTFPATILMVWSFFYFLKKKNKLTNILVIYTILIFLFFIFIPRPAFGYPRYFMTIFPGLSILIGIFLYENIKNLKLEKIKILLCLCSFIISLLLLIWLHPQGTFYESNGLIKATNLPDFTFNLIGSIPLFLVFLFKEDKKKILVLLLTTLMLSYSLYFDFKLLTHDSHIKEVGEYLKQKTNEKEKIIAPKAVAFYAERKFYINDNNKPILDFSLNHLKEYIIKSFENRNMNDEFFWPKGFYGGLYLPYPNETELKESSYAVLYHPVDGYVPEKIIGDFYLYNLKQLNI